MQTTFREWHTKEDIKKMMNWARNKAGNNEIVLIQVYQNIYGDDVLRVQFKTQTEKQAKFGYYSLSDRTCVLWKLPKKYQPHEISDSEKVDA